jgi:pyrroline-5-carboxylate reductase
MGEAIAGGLVQTGAARVDDLFVVEPIEERRRQLSRAHAGLRVLPDLYGSLPPCQAYLIAVKPQDFEKAAAALRAVLQPDQAVISIMAGIRLPVLVEKLGHPRVVRVMPNTPAALGKGFSAWIATDDVTAEQRELTRKVLMALGREAEVHEERYLDMTTAISGSGPAYVFLFLEAYINAGVHIGMPRALATEMVLQTVLGSLAMAQTSEQHLAALRDQVTSPGGTTAEALQVFERAGLRGIMTEAIQAAYEKSRALGG